MATIFNVLTEFKFEVGSALLGTDALRQGVEGVSAAADDALISFQKLGLGIVAQFGLGTGGVLGVLGKALEVSDKFKTSQIALANIIGNTGGIFTADIGTFEGRMQAASDVMAKINKLASEFALPADELLQFTKLISPILGSKGLAGVNFGVAVDISRNLLKSAPTLGIDTSLVQGQLMRLVEGQASMGDTLFTRLISDTKSFGQFKATGSKGFNALPEVQRVTLLQKALKEFAADTKVLEANVNTLNGQMRLFKNQISSATGILQPLGNAIMKPVLEVFRGINAFLGNEGRVILGNFGKIFENIFHGSAQSILATLFQLRDLSTHFTFIKTLFSVVGIAIAFNHALVAMGIQMQFLTAVSGAFTFIGSKLLGVLTSIVTFIAARFTFAGLFSALNGLTVFFSALMTPVEELLQVIPLVQ